MPGPEHHCYVVTCAEQALPTCQICKRYFCKAHGSERDPDFCSECVAPVTAEIKIGPLLEETETGNLNDIGRLIQPVGEYWISSAGAIAAMDDDKLGRLLDQYARRIHECERAVEYNRIMRSMVQLEGDERRCAKAKSLRGIKLKTPDGATISITRKGNEATVDPISAIAAAFAKAGLTKEKLAALMAHAKAAQAKTNGGK